MTRNDFVRFSFARRCNPMPMVVKPLGICMEKNMPDAQAIQRVTKTVVRNASTRLITPFV